MYNQAIIFITGSIGGFLAYLLSLPVPWLIGSLIIIALLSRKINFVTPNKTFSKQLRILLGVSIGGLASQTIDESSKDALPSILISVLVFVALTSFLGAIYFRKKLKLNKLDSLIASLPGGLTFIISISDGLGTSFPKIAMMHTVRMVMLIGTFTIFAFFTNANTDQAGASLEAFNIVNLINNYSNFETFKLLAIVLVAFALTKVIRFSGGDLILPLILSLIIYKSGYITIQMPEIINIVAMMVFGAILGQKIASKWNKNYIAQAKSSVIFTIFCLVTAILISLVISHYTNIDYFLIFLALAPGSIPEISLISIALGYDVGLVAITHILRYLFVMLIGATGVYWFRQSNKASIKGTAID